jgi:CubicO group peptidase (beta-lactamase class C family)
VETEHEAAAYRAVPSTQLMRSRSLYNIALTLGALLPLGGANGQGPACRAHVDSSSTALDSAIVAAMREHDVPGAAVAVVRDGRVERLVGYGCANIARGVAVDPTRTVFHVASVSKPFVALAAVQLVEQGAVDIHADVNRYLTTTQVPAGWNRPVTLHDLLTHTAGFEESIVGYAARTPADIRPLGEFLAAKLPKRGWPPGDVTAYSNYGYALAGYVVESVAHVSFADYVRTRILMPLGMTRSSFAQPMPEELARDAALSYRCSAERCDAITPDYRSAYPPGGLVTTADDMSRFMLAQLGAPLDGAFLNDTVLRLMHERQFSHAPGLPGLTYGFAEDNFAGRHALSHAGGASGYTSFVMLVPEQHVGAFVVANGGSSRFGAAASAAIERAVLPAAADDSVPAPRASVATPDPTGSYRLTRYAHRGVENLPALFNGQLHVARISADTIDVQGIGDANGRYVAVDSTQWRRVGGRDLVAVRMRDGKVTHFFAPQSFFGTRFPSAYERLAWFDSPHFLNEALSWVVAAPLLALLAWPIVAGIVWLVRRRTRLVARVRPPLGRTPRATVLAAAVLFVAIGLWFGFGFIAQTNRAAERGGGELVYGIPPMMRLLAWAPLVLATLTALLVAATPVAWRRRWWSVPGMLLFTLITVNAVAFVALLVRWGYFPIATG